MREEQVNRVNAIIGQVYSLNDTGEVVVSSNVWQELMEILVHEGLLEEYPEIYRTQKDRMFRFLFKDKKRLLELYNALNEDSEDYDNPDDLQVVTLENAIYMSMKNDLSFIISSKLFLYEHQSTENPNIPLRDLLYVAAQFRTLTVDSNIYSSSLIPLPTPHFVLFYNGRKALPEKFEYRLSDAYETKEEDYDLDLRVTCYNINPGMNEALSSRSESLRGYVTYFDKVKEYDKTMPTEIAVEQAIDYCIKNDILKDFFEHNRAEARNMVLFEFDQEKFERDMKKEAADLKVIVEEMEQQLEEKDQQLEEKDRQLEEQRILIEQLKSQLKG